MAPILSLSCLGPPQVVTAAGESVRFRTRKHLALLVRLALEPGRKLTRDYLTDLLWPEAPGRLAAHSLAQGLSVIRAHVGRAPVLVQRATVALQDGVVDVDVHHLENGEVAIRGAFLEGFDLPAARPFEDWKDEWRARLQPRVRDSLVKQMDAARRLGDFATVEHRARVLHELDPISEDAVRGLIEARAWVGDRSNALKAYAAYEARLAEELGAKPSPELQRMAGLLREGRSSGSPRARSVSEPGARAERRFEPETVIGREREFSVLYDAWLGARRRAPSIVVLTGDPGLGKTTLANAFVSTCQLEGAVVARAQAYDAERELPFAVLAELVRQLSVQRAIGGAEPEALSELSRLSPEVRAQFPGVPQPIEWAAEIVPLRLADAFLKTVTAAAEESPVVLVVDDVHASDNASAAILHLVARKLPATRLLLILAARSTELRASGAPAALTSDNAIDALRSIDLDPLPDEAAGRLVERVRVATGGEADGDVPLDRILRAGRGNPLALELLTREWVLHGPESLLRDLEAVNTQPAAALGIPRAIKAVFDRQVARLDSRTRAVLDLAAVLGRRLAHLSLYEAVDATPAQAAEALAHLRDDGFVREIHGDIEFRNELIRAQAYYAIPAPGRHHLHGTVGEKLSVFVGNGATVGSLEIAWHLLRGGRPEASIAYALQGAEDALGCGAPAEAEQILRTLLSSGVPELPIFRMNLLLATALINQSKPDAALCILGGLTQGQLSSKDVADGARLEARAQYLAGRGGSASSSIAAERAVKTAHDSGDPDVLARALFEYARSGAEIGDPGRVEAARRDVEAVIARHGMGAPPFAFYTLGYCQYFCHEPESGSRSVKMMIDRLGEGRDASDLLAGYTGYAICRLHACDLPGSEKAHLQAVSLARRMGDDGRAAANAANLAVVYQWAGDYAKAVAFGRKGVEWARLVIDQPDMLHAYLNLASALLLAGDCDACEDNLDRARKWLARERSWRSKVAFFSETISLTLMKKDVLSALDLIDQMDALTSGREDAACDAGALETYHVFKAAHSVSLERALETANRAQDRFRDRHLSFYLDATAARAWVENALNGHYSTQTARDLRLFDDLGLRGKKAVLAAQGFLDQCGA